MLINLAPGRNLTPGLLIIARISENFAIRATIYRSLRALRAQNRKKVSKRVFLGVRKKVPENTRKSQKIHQKVQFWVFFDFFGYFRALFCGPPKRLFWRLFCDFGPGETGDSCKWSLGSQRKLEKAVAAQEIPCWKSFRANFDAAGKLVTDFPAARNTIPGTKPIHK